MAKGDVGSRAVFFNFATNLGISALNLFTGVVTARLLQPTGRGELAAVLLWPTILADLGILGTNWALTREISARPNEEAQLAITALKVSLVLGVISMGVGYLAIPWLLPADKRYLAWIAQFFLLWLPVKFICLNLMALDHGSLRWRRFNFIRVSMVLPYALFLLLFIIWQIVSLLWFVIALLTSNVITAILLLIFHRHNFVQCSGNSIGGIEILRKGMPFFGAALSAVIAMQIDKALVVTLLPAEAVGCYAAALSFASAHTALGLALGLTSFAALANEPDRWHQGRYLAKIFRQSTLLYLGAGSLVALVAPVAIVPLFGQKFSPAMVPAAIMALTTSLQSLGNILNEGLRGLGNPLPGIVSQLLGSAVVAILAWMVVPTYGIVGLAWITALGGGLQLILLAGVVLWLFGLKPSHLWGVRVNEVKALYGRIAALLPN